MEKNCSQGLGEECSIKDKVELNRRAIKDKAEAVDTVEYHIVLLFMICVCRENHASCTA